VFIRELIVTFAQAHVRYCVVGGVALNLHGVPRMTYDVDLLIAPEANELRKVQELLVGLGLQRRIPVSLVDFADRAYCEQMRDERNLIAVTFTDPANPLREVDILVAPPVDVAGIVERAIRLPVAGVSVPVASIDDLISMKRAAGRAQDQDDIRYLEQIRNGARGG
jgi:Nucleotidyl transferase AbiEii toxin, Type IV TA system